MIDLARDVLDALVLDRRGRRLGRVDGIVVEWHDGRPPRVTAIEIGAVTAARRVHPRVVRWIEALARLCGFPVRPVQIGVAHIGEIEKDVKLTLLASDEPQLLAVEKWMREHIVDKIPGST